jgi:quercetin dioxygenase-like cupin family protein
MYSHSSAQEAHVSYTVVNKDELQNSGSTSEFEGYLHGDTDVSFILVDMQPGEGVRLHTHPYQEIFILQEGTATYLVGTTTLEARAGQIIIVEAYTPHKFVNSGEGLLLHDPVVEAALQEQLKDLTQRAVQYRFLQATGITQSTARQIERARYATFLLQQGVSILDTIQQAGYYDQPHLTRSLGRFIGQTPAQLLHHSRPEQLSFLYKTTLFP